MSRSKGVVCIPPRLLLRSAASVKSTTSRLFTATATAPGLVSSEKNVMAKSTSKSTTGSDDEDEDEDEDEDATRSWRLGGLTGTTSPVGDAEDDEDDEDDAKTNALASSSFGGRGKSSASSSRRRLLGMKPKEATRTCAPRAVPPVRS
jgi:hypothetical protein